LAWVFDGEATWLDWQQARDIPANRKEKPSTLSNAGGLFLFSRNSGINPVLTLIPRGFGNWQETASLSKNVR
jgi:hypothetical protein